MELNAIQQQSTWGDASAQINENFTKVGVAIEGIKDATTRNKGYYATAADLQSAFPTAPAGSKAYIGTSYPYAIYLYDIATSTWQDSGVTGGEESVDLGDYYTREETDAKVAELESEVYAISRELSDLSKNVGKDVEYNSEILKNLGYLRSDGTKTSELSSYQTSDYIYVNSGARVVVKASFSSATPSVLCAYAEPSEDSFIESLSTISGYNKEYSYTVPPTVRYIRVCAPADFLSDFYISIKIDGQIANKLNDVEHTLSSLVDDVNNVENTLISITETAELPIEMYSEIESSYINSVGNIAQMEGFSIRLYDVSEIQNIHLIGTGGGSAIRYAFYSSSEISKNNVIEIGPKMSGDEYSEIINVAQGAIFLAVTYRTSWEQRVLKVTKQPISTTKKSLKILCFGNSFTIGAMGYAPFLLKDHFREDIELTIGIAFISGGTLGATLNGVENQYQKLTEDTIYTYYKYVNNSQSWVSASAKPSDMFADENWDVVTFQQGSNNAPDYTTYQPYLNQCIDLVSQKVSSPVKIAWLTPHADANVYTQGKEQGILDSAERVMNETITEVLIPYGTAIANARTTSLKEIGDAGNLLYEGKHLQNGLPILVSNYCSMIVLLNLLGMNQKSIVGINSIEINDAWVSAHNIPNASAVGNCVGVTSENCRIAEKCAIMAVKNPYTIMQL